MNPVMFCALKEHATFSYSGYVWMKYSSTQAISHAMLGVYSFEQSALVTPV